jgi:hypothetical protein
VKSLRAKIALYNALRAVVYLTLFGLLVIPLGIVGLVIFCTIMWIEFKSQKKRVN